MSGLSKSLPSDLFMSEAKQSCLRASKGGKEGLDLKSCGIFTKMGLGDFRMGRLTRVVEGEILPLVLRDSLGWARMFRGSNPPCLYFQLEDSYKLYKFLARRG